MTKATGSPVLIPSAGGLQRLERIQLGAGLHDEEWLQALIFEQPTLLPITRIEPGFGSPVAAAREVPCGHGYIDNLYLTPAGEIILVETKLWRNVQARREVVAQALDYVSALMKMGYEAFEAAVLRGTATAATLHAIVAEHPEALDEAAFIDAVSDNLVRGRMMVIVLGDGIRREAEALAELLQSHAGAHFTFALVELATWRNPITGDILALPTTLAQTVMIERGVLRFVGSHPTIEPAPKQTATMRQSLTEEIFFEELAKVDASLPAHVRTFLARVAPLGVYAEFKASLNLKFDLQGSARPLNFGYIRKNGKLDTSPLSWTVSAEIGTQYNQRLAAAMGGQTATSSNSIYLSTNGSSEPFVSSLLPEHSEEWEDAIREVIALARQVDKAMVD
jgi:hypothetical protein